MYPYQVEFLLVDLSPSQFFPAIMPHTRSLWLLAEWFTLWGSCWELGVQRTATHLIGPNLEQEGRKYSLKISHIQHMQFSSPPIGNWVWSNEAKTLPFNGTVEEASRLWTQRGTYNVLVKELGHPMVYNRCFVLFTPDVHVLYLYCRAQWHSVIMMQV